MPLKTPATTLHFKRNRLKKLRSRRASASSGQLLQLMFQWNAAASLAALSVPLAKYV
jgi:hypothetical protein